MIKGFRQIASLTVLSRILGMLRDMSFAYFLGAGALMDAWVIAFKIPNLARRLFGEGAAASSLIPVYSDRLENDPPSAARLAGTVIISVFLVLLSLVVLGEGIIWSWFYFFAETENTRLTLSLSGLMLPYMLLICMVAIVAGILNAHRHFFTPAFAPVLLNIFIIISICTIGWVFGIQPARLVYIVAVFVVIAGITQIASQFAALRFKKIPVCYRPDFRSPAFRRILIMMGPMILGLTVTQINTLLDDFIALSLSGSEQKGTDFLLFGRLLEYPVWEGAVSHLFYSQRLYQMPLGVFGISLATAVFPVMSSAAAKKDYAELSSTVSKALKCVFFIAIPATLGLILVKEPLISVLFERGRFEAQDTLLTSRTLTFYAIGLTAFFAQQIVTRAFYSIHDSKLPAVSAAAAVLINFTLNLVLIWPMGTAGLALSTALSSLFQVVFMLKYLSAKMRAPVLKRFFPTAAKTIASSAVMSAAAVLILFSMRNMADNTLTDLIRLALTVPISAAAYLFSAKMMKMKEISLITGKKDS